MVALAGCAETSLAVIEVPVRGAGTGEASFEAEGWQITIERADLGFGPLYLCATSFSDADECAVARAEWLGTGSIDALDDAPQQLGDAGALTATVRSAMYDYGRSWPVQDTAPRANEGAPRGRSAVFVVRARRGEEELEIRASVDVDPPAAGEPAAFGVSTDAHAITDGDALTVRFDPAAWWRGVDFDALALSAGEGGVVEVTPGDGAYEHLVTAVRAGRRPTFEWD